jgi:hypothetical protein
MFGKGELQFEKRPKKKLNKDHAAASKPVTSTASANASATGSVAATTSNTSSSASPSNGKHASASSTNNKSKSENDDDDDGHLKESEARANGATKKKDASAVTTGGSKPTTSGGGDENRDDEEEAEMKEPVNESEYLRAYMGYFLGDTVGSGGILTTVDTQVPRILSRLNRHALAPIITMQLRNEKTSRRIRRKVEKFGDMQLAIRAILARKKSRIFRQQRHITKKTMYADDLYYEGTTKKDLDDRMKTRTFRLKETDLNLYKPSKALVPRLGLISTEPVTHLTKKYNLIQPDVEDGHLGRIRRMLPRIVASDFEEVFERQRFLKYDRVWQRAEEAFFHKKSAIAEAEAAAAAMEDEDGDYDYDYDS